MRYYIIGMLLLQTPLALYHVSLKLHQISEHFQDAPLTKLLSLLKYIKLNFFYSILKNWGLNSPLKASNIYIKDECGLKKHILLKSQKVIHIYIYIYLSISLSTHTHTHIYIDRYRYGYRYISYIYIYIYNIYI